MAGKILMVAIQSFVGIEGMIYNGQEFEAENQQRAEELQHYKLAKPAKEDQKQGQEQQGDGQEGNDSLEDTKGRIEAANSHAKLDAIIKDLGIENIPGKDDAKLDERKAAVLEAL